MFNEVKAVQAAVYLLRKAEVLSHDKLFSLLYLADFESLAAHGTSITTDPYSDDYDETLGVLEDLVFYDPNSVWTSSIEDLQDSHGYCLRSDDASELGELCEDDEAYLNKVWTNYGSLSEQALKDITDPMPKYYSDILRYVGWAEDDIAAAIDEAELHDAFVKLLEKQ